MARTPTQIRQLTLQQTGLRFITGTADSGGSTTTIKDSILQVYGNDKLIGLWTYLLDGADALTESVITDSVQSTGVATIRTTLSGAPDTDTYEISPFPATETHRAIQDAGLELYAEGWLTRKFVGYMVAGSPIYNADWGYWDGTSTVDGWTLTTATLTRERASGNTYNSPTSIKLTNPAGSFALDAQWRRFLLDMRGETVTLYCPVKSNTSSSARINFIANGSNNFSPYHGGGDDWEILSVEVSLNNTDSDAYPVFLHDVGAATSYFGMPWFERVSEANELPMPTNLLPDGPTSIRAFQRNIMEDEIASGRGVIETLSFGSGGRNVTFDYYRHQDEDALTDHGVVIPKATPGSLLRVFGDGPVTVIADASATQSTAVEVSYSEIMMLAVKAAILLLERAIPKSSTIAKQEFARQISKLETRLANLQSSAGQSTDHAPLPMGW